MDNKATLHDRDRDSVSTPIADAEDDLYPLRPLRGRVPNRGRLTDRRF
jgi:hypothetical protein